MASRSTDVSSGRALVVASTFGLVVGILGGACFLAGPQLVQLFDGVRMPTRFAAGLVCGLAIALVAPRLMRTFQQRSSEALPLAPSQALKPRSASSACQSRSTSSVSAASTTGWPPNLANLIGFLIGKHPDVDSGTEHMREQLRLS